MCVVTVCQSLDTSVGGSAVQAVALGADDGARVAVGGLEGGAIVSDWAGVCDGEAGTGEAVGSRLGDGATGTGVPEGTGVMTRRGGSDEAGAAPIARVGCSGVEVELPEQAATAITRASVATAVGLETRWFTQSPKFEADDRSRLDEDPRRQPSHALLGGRGGRRRADPRQQPTISDTMTELRGRIVDAADGRALEARVRVVASTGELAAPAVGAAKGRHRGAVLLRRRHVRRRRWSAARPTSSSSGARSTSRCA